MGRQWVSMGPAIQGESVDPPKGLAERAARGSTRSRCGSIPTALHLLNAPRGFGHRVACEEVGRRLGGWRQRGIPVTLRRAYLQEHGWIVTGRCMVSGGGM
jgi:hypothetical protein